MLKKTFLALAILFAAFIGAGFFLPIHYHVERSAAIERPAATVFTLLNSYRTFNRWSPWAERDPGAHYALTGPDSGPGARLDWSGDPRLVGTGWQEITLSRPFERIEMHLDFGAQGTADSYYDLSSDGQGTRLTWGFDTDVTRERGFFGALMGRYFGLFLDRWIGSDYEQGLARFKAFAESLPGSDFAGADIRVLDVQPVPILFVRGSGGGDAVSTAAALGAAFAELGGFIAQHGIEVTGQPMAISRAWDETGYRFDAALPVDRLPERPGAGIGTGLSPGGRAVRIVHRGPYALLPATYEQLAAFMAAHGLRQGPVSWEHYISDPGNTPPEKLLTHVYFQVGE
jgi:effector-binding domain-containing protein